MKSKREKIITTIAKGKMLVFSWRIEQAPPGQIYRINEKHNFS